MVETVVLVGIFVGILLRTLLPAMRKWMEDEDFSWNHKYTATLVTSVIIAFVTAMFAFESFVIPEDGLTTVFIAAFTFGFGLDAGLNEMLKWVQRGLPEGTKEESG